MSYSSTARSTQPELMDDPKLDAKTLKGATDDINRINRLLGGFDMTADAIAEVAETMSGSEQIHVLDFGCGDGEMLRYLYQRFGRRKFKFTGLDVSSNSISRARELSRGVPGIRFCESDILTTPPEQIKCDILICTLTLHHFSDMQIIELLNRFKMVASRAIIINDLHRHRLAYHFFRLFSPIFTQNRISQHDGLISIASGFKRKELEYYASEAGLQHYTLEWKWSFRYIWTIHL